jgi:hypothetical protein
MRRLLPIVGAALVVAPPANAKLCASVRVLPDRTHVGARAELRLTTWIPHWVKGRAEFGRHASLPTRDPARILVSPPHGAAFNAGFDATPSVRGCGVAG